jgi:hypothetical protein
MNNIKSQAVFLNAFHDWCIFIENEDRNETKEYLQLLRTHLLKIYNSGLNLSTDINPGDDKYPEYLEPENIRSRILQLSEKLINNRYYWEVFDPTDTIDNQPVCGDLIDDITDIYHDIKSALLIHSINTADAKATSVWQLEFQFRTHWGNHCINALRACHYFIQKAKTL